MAVAMPGDTCRSFPAPRVCPSPSPSAPQCGCTFQERLTPPGRSPGKRKNKSSSRRSKSPRNRRSRSPHHVVVKVKQERDDHSRRGHDERKHRDQPEQEHRRERDRHRDHSDRRKNSSERPGGRGHERERDSQNLREQQAEREFNDERRRENRQKNEASNPELGNPELGRSDSKTKDKEPANKEKPSFELSGALLEDSNTFRGVVIKYSEPPEARIPKKRWRLYPFKNDEVLPVMYIHRQSAYLLGRHRRIADIPIDHPSCSKQHAVFQYRLVEYTRADGTVGRRVRPYIIDLGSGNGTFLNNQRIEPKRYYELKEKDVLKFGFSSREYVLLHESSDKSEADTKEEEVEEEEKSDNS
ncbi:smad nuclear-interacting protein 1 [Alligator sinensis]|uniref:Smad nuclear-interacting protein 1 n=1 Tax=Alligator sinensis TaxID=38654 RepID=A0A1U7SMF0_ALLSI|nr:smad nuclear-interacting protein 1 [Alligator sinensis]